MKKPIIGVTLDEEKGGDQEGSHSDYPYYALRKNYFDAIIKAGGTPIGLPYNVQDIDQYLELIDGLVVTGGNFDISPEMYGEKDVHATVTTKADRTEFEYGITKKSLAQDLPILGICGGEQLIAVLMGCTLIQDIESEVENALEHEVKNRECSAHEITIEKNSILHKIVKKEKLGVNTSHHQAVKNVGENVIITAKSSDGIIEAIESTQHKFCLGVQWHPEYLFNPEELDIFKEFVKVCG